MAAGLTPRAIDASTRLLTVLNLKYRPFACSLKIIRLNYYQLILCTTIAHRGQFSVLKSNFSFEAVVLAELGTLFSKNLVKN